MHSELRRKDITTRCTSTTDLPYHAPPSSLCIAPLRHVVLHSRHPHTFKTGEMSRPRPRPRPARRCLFICLCLLILRCNAFSPPPQSHPPSAAAGHRRLPQPLPRTIARAAAVGSGNRRASPKSWRVSTARYPLIGWPSWGPKLHVAVIVERSDANAAAAAPAYLLFDFIPAAATEISTATSLFRGQAVPGLIREKVSVCMLKGGL